MPTRLNKPLGQSEKGWESHSFPQRTECKGMARRSFHFHRKNFRVNCTFGSSAKTARQNKGLLPRPEPEHPNQLLDSLLGPRGWGTKALPLPGLHRQSDHCCGGPSLAPQESASPRLDHPGEPRGGQPTARKVGASAAAAPLPKLEERVKVGHPARVRSAGVLGVARAGKSEGGQPRGDFPTRCTPARVDLPGCPEFCPCQ